MSFRRLPVKLPSYVFPDRERLSNPIDYFDNPERRAESLRDEDMGSYSSKSANFVS